MSLEFHEGVYDHLKGEVHNAALGAVVVGSVRVLNGSATWRSYLPHDGITGGPCPDVDAGKRLLGEHVERWLVATGLRAPVATPEPARPVSSAMEPGDISMRLAGGRGPHD